jgi:long-chain-fatty-acid---luciferin-component ligase
VGLLVFLDPTPASYPGFVLSGDLGRISHVDDCPCGRPGVCIEVIRRVSTIESRGCAQRIARQYRGTAPA